MRSLAGDLTAETAELTGLVVGLTEAGWRTPTPAPGWTIADQVSHLAFFDDAAISSATDPSGFAADLARAAETGQLNPDDVAERYRSLTGEQVLAWFGASRNHLIEVFVELDPSARLPWFGLPMSAASALTARLMETWAHGQDVADALRATRAPSARLRHVAHIGVRALPFSFAVNGLDQPAEPVRVELTAPVLAQGGDPLKPTHDELAQGGDPLEPPHDELAQGGDPLKPTHDDESWTWGPPTAANRVTGPALDFCLLVTQRRHRDDTALVAGSGRRSVLDIAQAFAKPAGHGLPVRSAPAWLTGPARPQIRRPPGAPSTPGDGCRPCRE
jgi:uncharacterized protein (TIGR03084 family)